MRLDAVKGSKLYKYSQKLNLPFDVLIQQYVFETTIALIGESKYKEQLLLKNFEDIQKGLYREIRSGRLEYYYLDNNLGEDNHNQLLSKEMLEYLYGEIFEQKKKWNVEWEKEKIITTERNAYILIEGKIEEFKVPMEIRLNKIELDHISPKRWKINLVTDEKKEITFLTYPIERVAGTLLIDIIMKLELVTDMEKYFRLYDILAKHAISGREVISIFEEYQKNEKSFEKDTRIKQLKSYRDYPYMRKRWERYQKHHKNIQIQWSELMDCIIRFIEPVWGAFKNKEIFLEDWMPELGRFLE